MSEINEGHSWRNSTLEETNKFLLDQAERHKFNTARAAKRLKRPGQEKMKVLDPISGQLLDLTMTEASDYMNKLQERESEERRRKEDNKNLNFIQLKKGIAPEVISSIAEESALAVQVLMFFFKNMSNDGVLVVSQSTIGQVLDKTRQGIGKAVKILEQHKAIARGKVGGSSIVYIINPEVAWQQSHTKKKILYAQGVVMLNADENKDIFKQFEAVNSLDLKNLSIKTGNARVAQSKTEGTAPSTKTVPLEIEIDNPDEFEFEPYIEDEFDELQPGERPPENY